MGRFPRSVARLFLAAAAFIVLAPAAQAIEMNDLDQPAADELVLEQAAAAPTVEAMPALYDGRVIDISKDWEGATTCVVVDALTLARCYDSAAERDAGLEQLGLASLFEEAAAPSGASFAFASCSSYLKLYDGYSYGGASLWLNLRSQWLNLSNYGFNQRASSYKVGGCNTAMADYNNGGGAWISTSLTQAWDKDAVIGGSWNNDVSSVYIY